MSTPSPSWGRVALPPTSKPQAAPKPGQQIVGEKTRIMPWTPGDVATRAWFLGDILTVKTHFGERSTVPCLGDGCPLCATPPRINGFAAALVRGGNTLDGEEIWIPRVLRVFERNFTIGEGLRGRVYQIKKTSGPKIKGGEGGVNKWEFTFSYSKTPPIDEFDVPAVMNSVWFPHAYPPVYLDDLKIAVKPKPAERETTFAESLKEMPNDALVDLLATYRRTNSFPGQLRLIEEELHTRDVKLSTDPPGKVDMSVPPEPKPGKLGYKAGIAYFEADGEARPETIPMLQPKPQSKRAKGGAA